MGSEFRTLFGDNYDDVVERLRRAGAPADVAADCAQEAFVRAYARWWRVGHYRRPAAWVQRVATNVWHDVHRGRLRLERAVTVLAATDTAPVHDGQGLLDDANPVVEQALTALSPQQRRAVDAYYGGGMSTEEGARELGISAGAFRFHLHQARTNLRPLLSAGDAGGED